MSDLKMPDINTVTVAGRLCADPELRYTSAAVPVCSFRVAVSRTYKTRDGDRREETLFIGATAWDKQAEYLNEKLRKGRPVLVEGRLTSNEWEDKSGQKRTTIEIRADRVQQLDWDGEAQQDAPKTAAKPQRNDDDIPF